MRGCSVEAEEAFEERATGLEDARLVRALWRRQRELERVLEDRLEIEPGKTEPMGRADFYAELVL